MLHRSVVAQDATEIPARNEIKLYGDGATLSDFKRLYSEGVVTGFTTNPSLMRKAGVEDYEAFARELLSVIPDMPVTQPGSAVHQKTSSGCRSSAHRPVAW